MNVALGDACTALEYYDVALFAYKTALKSDPTNEVVLKAIEGLQRRRERRFD